MPYYQLVIPASCEVAPCSAGRVNCLNSVNCLNCTTCVNSADCADYALGASWQT